ncbi:MAG: hypothetical protein WCJ60_01245 [bacterium]
MENGKQNIEQPSQLPNVLEQEALAGEVLNIAKEQNTEQNNPLNYELFDSIPEHGGNLKELLNKYKNKPGEQCPFIKSMGAAGIDLVQKLAATEDDVNRGPTIKELIKAKKNAMAAKQLEHKEVQVQEEIHYDKQREIFIKKATELNDKTYIDTVNIDPMLSHKNDAKTEDNTNIKVAKNIKISSPINLNVLPKKSEKTQILKTPTATFSNPAINTVNKAQSFEIIDDSNTSSDIIIPPNLEYFIDNNQMQEEPVTTTELENLQNIITETISTEDTIINLELKPIEETDIELNLPEEIINYVKLLDPEIAENVNTAIEEIKQTFINAVDQPMLNKSLDALDTNKNIETLNNLCINLLKTLGIEQSDENISFLKLQTKLLLNNELAVNINQQIDELNYLGTNEHKITNFTSFITNLASLIKQKILPYFNLGKYAIRFSTI